MTPQEKLDIFESAAWRTWQTRLTYGEESLEYESALLLLAQLRKQAGRR